MKNIRVNKSNLKITTMHHMVNAFIIFSLALLLKCGGVSSSSSANSSSSGSSVAFTSDVISGTTDLAVTFTDTTTSQVISREWDFGDGTKSTEKNPEHIYTAVGKYTVTLTVTGASGTDSLVRTNCIIVLDRTYPVVDTGVTLFYGDTSSTITKPSSSASAFYGQDAQYTGNTPAYQNNGDGTITDLNTGLMWQSEREAGTRVTWDAAVAGASGCTTGGYSDWRMPTIKELYSLIQFTGKSGGTDAQCIPYIDTDFFEIRFGDQDSADLRVIDGQDWSSNKYVYKTMVNDETVFGVNFVDGRIKGYPQYKGGGATENTMYVRYVRGNTKYGINSFTDNGDGTISDSATGLMWAQSDSGTGMDWEDGLAWVQMKNNANYLGHSDWRMPNSKELHTILDYTRSPDTTSSAAIDPVFLSTSIINEKGQTEYPYIWSGTTHLEGYGAAYFSFGRALGYMLTGTYYTLYDVHGAGAQRSDPKTGSPTDHVLGLEQDGDTAYGWGPQGDILRITNYVRLVRNI